MTNETKGSVILCALFRYNKNARIENPNEPCPRLLYWCFRNSNLYLFFLFIEEVIFHEMIVIVREYFQLEFVLLLPLVRH